MTRFVLTVAFGLTLAIALLLTVGACAESESVVPPNVTVSPTAVPPTPTIHAHTVAVRGAATASVAARIYYSDVVVRATLLSTSGGSLRFRAIEYLKGSGPQRVHGERFYPQPEYRLGRTGSGVVPEPAIQ